MSVCQIRKVSQNVVRLQDLSVQCYLFTWWIANIQSQAAVNEAKLPLGI